MKLIVVSRYHPDSLSFFEGDTDNDNNNNENDRRHHHIGDPILNDDDHRNDNLDDFNHPRFRRAIILRELAKRRTNDNDKNNNNIEFRVPTTSSSNDMMLSMYSRVQSDGLLEFLMNSWTRWVELGDGGRDPASSLGYYTTNGNDPDNPPPPPALIPGNMPLPREDKSRQRPSRSVMGQIGYYCTDTCTAVFAQLREELLWDASIVKEAVEEASGGSESLAYALVTHPGHHAAQDSFGGYCYLNHAACAAKLFQETKGYSKVAVLDVDYHVGNGTASIFYEDPNVLVISIHCHPDYEYPFHSGFYDEIGSGDGIGATLHLPLMPGATWTEYGPDLDTALNKIVNDFGAQALVLSLGLDTHDGDPCAIRRAGFRLSGEDYSEMGRRIGRAAKAAAGGSGGSDATIPTVVIQEGGYRMDKVPGAAADVLCGFLDGAASC